MAQGREERANSLRSGSLQNACAQKGIAGHPAGEKHRVDVGGFRRLQGALHEVVDDSVLKTGD